MSRSDIISDHQEWHRQIAMRCNNRAWALSTLSRTSADDREMLDAAHASAWHWTQVGTELNRMRATMLLAQVHALLGHGDAALSFATDMRSYFLGRNDTPDWELAFTHTIYAHCAYSAGNTEAYRAAYQEAAAALSAIADEEDRQVVTQTFKQIPVP